MVERPRAVLVAAVAAVPALRRGGGAGAVFGRGAALERLRRIRTRAGLWVERRGIFARLSDQNIATDGISRANFGARVAPDGCSGGFQASFSRSARGATTGEGARGGGAGTPTAVRDARGAVAGRRTSSVAPVCVSSANFTRAWAAAGRGGEGCWMRARRVVRALVRGRKRLGARPASRGGARERARKRARTRATRTRRHAPVVAARRSASFVLARRVRRRGALTQRTRGFGGDVRRSRENARAGPRAHRHRRARPRPQSPRSMREHRRLAAWPRPARTRLPRRRNGASAAPPTARCPRRDWGSGAPRSTSRLSRPSGPRNARASDERTAPPRDADRAYARSELAPPRDARACRAPRSLAPCSTSVRAG